MRFHLVVARHLGLFCIRDFAVLNVLSGELGGRYPGTEEIALKTNNNLRFVEAISRNRSRPKTLLVGLQQGRTGGRIVDDDFRIRISGFEISNGLQRHWAHDGWSYNAHAATTVQFGHDFFVDLRQRWAFAKFGICPINLTTFYTVRAVKTTRIIKAQYTGLGTCTGATFRYTGKAVAFDLDRAAFTSFHQNGAIITPIDERGSIIGGYPWYNFVGFDDVWNRFSNGNVTTCSNGRCTQTKTQVLQEVPTVGIRFIISQLFRHGPLIKLLIGNLVVNRIVCNLICTDPDFFILVFHLS